MAKSYKDPLYSSLDLATSEKLGLPDGLLSDIRLKGERSNADQVSSAGAKTVYQIIPATREAAIKKWGVDPYLSPENASLVAGYLLKDSLDRNQGDVQSAVAEYHGGTDRANWGNKTKAYVARVTGAYRDPVQATTQAPVGGDLPSDAELDNLRAGTGGRQSQQQPPKNQLANIFKAYQSGEMPADVAAEFENDVNSGKVFLPRGMKLKGGVTADKPAKTASIQVPASVVEAYNSGDMPEDVAEELRSDVAMGRATLPTRAKLDAPGLVTRAANAVGEAVTGNKRMTAETYSLPDWASMPEMNQLSAASFKSAVGTLMSSPEETVKVIQSNFPGVQVRQDENGNYLMKSSVDGKEYAIKPGFQMSDVPRVVSGVAAFTPAGRAKTVLGSAAAATGTQAAIEASQAATGGEFNPADVAIAGAGGAAVPAVVRGVQAVRNIAAPAVSRVAQAVRGAPQAAEQTIVQKADAAAASVPRDVAMSGGRMTEEGREAAVRAGVTSDDLMAAYGRVEASPSGARAAEAASEWVPLSRGQATKDFTTQEAEQTLRAAATGEGEQARQFFANQQEAIQGAVERFRTAMGASKEIPKAERGQAIKDAVQDLRDQGQAGVRALYKEAADTAGDTLPLKTEGILDAADEVILNRPTESAVADGIERAMAKYGLIGKVEEGAQKGGRYSTVVTDDGKNIRIRGEVEPLTSANAEEFRQALNQVYAGDRTGVTSIVIRALDDAVEEGLTAGASAERAGAFKAAREANKTQKQTFSAKDVVQQMTDLKKGTKTPVILPERVFAPLFEGGPEAVSNIKKLRGVLLTNPTEESRQAWKAVQAQAVSDIFNAAESANGAISGAKLNAAIKKFGEQKLKAVLDEDAFNQVQKLRRVIGDATIPIEGTTNPSGSGYKVINFILRNANTFTGGVGSAAAALARKARDVVQARKTLEGITDFRGEAYQAAEKTAAKANRELYESFMRMGQKNALVPFAVQSKEAF